MPLIALAASTAAILYFHSALEESELDTFSRLMNDPFNKGDSCTFFVCHLQNSQKSQQYMTVHETSD